MSDIKLSDLGVGSREKYLAAFAAIRSDKILDADEAELAYHARALATYHVDYKGEDQIAAALIIHNLQFTRVTERLSAQTEKQTAEVIRLTEAILWLTRLLCLIAIIQIALMVAQYFQKNPVRPGPAIEHSAPK